MSLGTLGSIVLGAGDEDVEISLDQSTGNTLTFSQLAVGVNLSPGGSNSFALTQLASATMVRVREASNTLVLTQAAFRVHFEDASNTLDFDDEATFLKFKIVSATNALVLAHTITTLGTYNREIFQAYTLTNLATRTISRLTDNSNSLGFSQVATAYAAKGARNELGFTDEATAFIAKKANNALELTQSVALNIVANRELFSSFEPIGKAVAGPNTLRRSMNSNFSLFDTAVGFAVKGVEQEITFTQTATGQASKKVANLVGFEHEATYNAVFNVTGRPSQCRLNLVQSATVNLVKFVSAQSVFAMEQLTTQKHVLFASASNVFGVTQDVIPGERHYESASNVLDFDQIASAGRVLTVAAQSVFAPVQTLSRTVVFNLSASNELIFTKDHQHSVNIGGVTYLTVPNAIGVVVHRYIILQGLNHTVVMPRPEFDDSEAFGGSMVILRSKSGGKRIYKKGTNKATLSYQFVIQQAKVDELKAFIRIYNSIPFYLENHKAERWYVTFKSNPFTFTESALWSCGNKHTITLEFEGVRLH